MSYNTADFLEFQSQFGRNIVNSPVVLPAFANYFQDMNGGLSILGNLTLLGGERMFPVDEPNKTYPDFGFSWYVDGVFMTSTHNPIINELKPEGYDGVLSITLKVIHKPTNTIYERTQWAFLDWNDEPNTLEGGDRPMRWDVFYDFYPDSESFGDLKWDLDDDGVVSTTDLLTFIADYNQPSA